MMCRWHCRNFHRSASACLDCRQLEEYDAVKRIEWKRKLHR